MRMLDRYLRAGKGTYLLERLLILLAGHYLHL